MNVLAVEGLTKRYPNFVLENITFSIRRKEHYFKSYVKFGPSR